VIEAVPGTILKEMERNRRWAYCCGSGAKIVSACYPEFAADVTGERLEEPGRAARSIVIACATCVSRMARFARKKKLDVQINDLSVFVARATGIADNNT
jgi:Fe-S oxidoreductase